MVPREALDQALSQTIVETDFPELGAKSEGKVRDSYTLGDGRRLLVVTDRISAFDHVLGTIPFKGQVLNRLAAWWFRRLDGSIPNHFLSMPDPNVLECVECTPILAEMVVRGYLTGSTSTSVWTHYRHGGRRFCGNVLPDGLRKNQALPQPILTPTTKAPKGQHDRSLSREEILATGLVSANDFDEAAELALSLYQLGCQTAAERGLILVDTKYEFGRSADGKLMVIDEVHTPDSSRYWRADSYQLRLERGEDPEPLDKDFVRRYYTDAGYQGDGPPPPLPDEIRIGAAIRYIEAFEAITGEEFKPDLEQPLTRIRRNLANLRASRASR